MSKFVTMQELENRLTGIKNNLKDVKDDVKDLFSVQDDLFAKIDTLKEAININSDGCVELEETVNNLSARIDKVERSLRECQKSISAQNGNSNGAGIAFCVLVTGACVIAVALIADKVDKLEMKLAAKRKAEAVSEKPFCDCKGPSESDATDRKEA